MPEESTMPDLVERWERLVEAFNTGDFDLVASFYAPDARFYPRAAVGIFEGREAIRGFSKDSFGTRSSRSRSRSSATSATA
jgi:ketosteroid isomerase-like protein